MKPQVIEHRYDFRGGRNTAISPDLLNPNELVDCTNARLSSIYGGFAKRTGSQRIHASAFPAAVNGVTQWDVPSGKQTVVISNGSLYYRNGFSFVPAFTLAPTSTTLRSSAAQGTSAGWNDPDGVNDGKNIITGVAVDTTSAPVAAASRLVLTVGDPAANNNRDAVDDYYTFSFKVTADGTSLAGTDGFVTAKVTLEVSVDGGAYAAVGSTYSVMAGVGQTATTKFSPTLIVAGAPAISVTFRPILTVSAGKASLGTTGTGAGSVQCFDTVYLTNNYPVTWTTGFSAFSTTQPAIFAPFRASSAGAPLVLYIASGGHYFSWNGGLTGTSSDLVQLDGTNSAPGATAIIAYHTRMFAMSSSTSMPGLLSKTIFWSIIGDATDFRTGDKSKGGTAVTDFLTGQQLAALEVIGSSLLMATTDSVMRFTGHASDDIVISQDTEGITAEVGSVGLQTLKRYENVAAMLSDRGPYVVTETYAQPSGEQLNPDWNGLDTMNLSKSSIEYNHQRKELLFAVPGASDGGTPKTVFSQSIRLQAWQGPWIYPFTINCMGKYFDVNNLPNVLSGSTDGFVRLMDVGSKDDVLSDGTGGSNITMTVEIPVIHFEIPGLKKALKWIIVQGDFPLTSTPVVSISFDGAAFTNFSITPSDTGEEDYRVDAAGDTSQGFRLRTKFTDASDQIVTINGFSIIGWNMQRTT